VEEFEAPGPARKAPGKRASRGGAYHWRAMASRREQRPAAVRRLQQIRPWAKIVGGTLPVGEDSAGRQPVAGSAPRPQRSGSSDQTGCSPPGKPKPGPAFRSSARIRTARPIAVREPRRTRKREPRRSGWTRAKSRARSPSRRRGARPARGRGSTGNSGRSARPP